MKSKIKFKALDVNAKTILGRIEKLEKGDLSDISENVIVSHKLRTKIGREGYIRYLLGLAEFSEENYRWGFRASINNPIGIRKHTSWL